MRCQSNENIQKLFNKERGDALVVFTDTNSLKILRFLKKGFRHCFVVVRVGDQWIVCDPLSDSMGLAILGGTPLAELIEWYTERGATVLPTVVRRPPHTLAPVRPFTCVEAVKRVLGIHAGWVLTPWALYQYLATNGFRQKDVDTLAK